MKQTNWQTSKLLMLRVTIGSILLLGAIAASGSTAIAGPPEPLPTTGTAPAEDADTTTNGAAPSENPASTELREESAVSVDETPTGTEGKPKEKPAIGDSSKSIPSPDSPPAPTDAPKPDAGNESIKTAGWTTLMTQDFEGTFPTTGWSVFDGDGATNGEYFWDDDDYLPYAGTWSAWAANGGANGLDPASYFYPNSVKSWMIYGPFDLSDATDAELTFYYWNQSEASYDWLGWYASIDGTNFSGTRVSGDSGGWTYVNFDLTAVPGLGNVTGDSSVWIASYFTSDGSNVDDGPFVDDIVLQKYIPSSQANLTPYTPSGWDHPIVPSNVTGTHTVSSLYATQPTYIDWAVVNAGATTSTTFTSCLNFDGSQIQCWNTNGLTGGYYAFVEDWVMNLTPTSGNHTLQIVADVYNQVAESNEGDNTWQWTFNWIGATCGPYSSTADNLTIPDNGAWLERRVVISDAPADAQIDKMVLKYRITHAAPEELEMELVREDSGKSVNLWNHQTAATNVIAETSAAVAEFNGESPNGVWVLRMRDTVPGHEGILEYYGLRAYYDAPYPDLVDTGASPAGVRTTLALPSALDAPTPTTGGTTTSPETALGWVQFYYENFEGEFPGTNWQLLDISDDGCEFLWDDDDKRPYAGGWAGWPANGGANGLDPAASKYPPNMNSWMIYGPFDLSDASDARATFQLWLETELNYDYLFFGVSGDGVNFSGYTYSGSADWTEKVVGFADYAGDSSVWLAFVFQSDSSNNYEGAWIDTLNAEKYVGPINCDNGFSNSALSIEELARAYERANKKVTTTSAQSGKPYEIALQSRQFVPKPGIEEGVQTAATESQSGRVHLLVQLYDIPTPEQKDALAEQGIELLHYLPSRAWIAAVDQSAIAGLADNPLIRWVGVIQAKDRTSDMLQSRIVQSMIAEASGSTLPLLVEFAGDVSLTQARELIRNHGGSVVFELESINGLVVEVPGDILDVLAHEDVIIWIELPLPFAPLNDCVRQRIGGDSLQDAPYNLSGSGVDMLVYDAGTIASTHSAFSGRLTVADSSGTGDHATHVGGTAAGDGTGSPSSRNLKGFATLADIVSYGFEGSGSEWLYNYPGDIESDWQTAKNTYGADLGTASIGTNVASNGFPCDWEGNYGSVGQLLDAIVRGSLGEPYIATWAAGNERSNGRCGTGFNTTAPPANAKNPIHVGATYSDSDVITNFSSFGPSDDGRIKPTIAAPGCEQLGEGFVNSTLPSNRYGESGYCGTSMATPAVAGLASLMIEQYRTTYGTSGELLPSSVKALLIHTAVDKGNAGPDYQYGYGRVYGVSAVDAIIGGDLREESIALTGEYHDYTFSFSSSIPELRVSLAWDDAAATPSSQTQLVNDLDLTVVSPSETSYYPFILNPSDPGATAVTGADHLNNQEQIIIPNPSAGTWTIRVRANVLPVTPQSYSIVFDGARTAPVDKVNPCYTLTTNVNPGGSGTVGANPAPNCAGGKYTHGTVVTLTATAGSGYTFANWSGDLSGSTNPANVTMNGARSVTANFAVAPAPEVDVQGNGVSIVDGDTTPTLSDHTDFGSVDASSGTVTRTYTIYNTGNAALTVGTVGLSGANASDFSVIVQPSSPVSAGGSTTFQVRFDPSASGLRSATVSFTNNDGNENPFDFGIAGTGAVTTAPEVDVQGNAVSIADGDTTPTLSDHTDFGSVDVSSGTVTRTYTIYNTGNAALTVGTVGLSGANASDFSVIVQPSSPVSAGGSTTFQVRFDPSASGLRSATVSFTNNDGDENPFDFAIAGTGTVATAPEVDVQGNAVSIADGDTTPTLSDHTDFGSVDVSSGTVTRTYTIYNTGTAALTVGTAGLSGANASDFSVIVQPSSPVSAGGSTTFQVRFDPRASGLRSATVSFTNNDGDETPFDFAIAGTGTIPPPALSTPKDGAAVYSRTPNLKWKSVKTATAYHIQVDDEPTFSSPYVIDTDTGTPNYPVPPTERLALGTYYWHVSAKVNDEWTDYSMLRSFDVTLLKAPRKNAAITTHRPKFTWLKVKGATLPYRIRVWDDQGCGGYLFWEAGSRKPSYTPPSYLALPLGTYYWQVTADNWLTQTPCWRFDVTTLKSPKAGAAVNSLVPKFTWAKNTLATGGYQITVINVPENGDPNVVKIDAKPTTKPTYTARSADALDFGRYLWHVEECIGTCDGTSLTPDRAFDLTNMVAPKDNLFTLTGKMTFRWKKVPGASGYALWVSTDPDFNTTTFPVTTTNALKRVSPIKLPRGIYYWHIVTGSGKTMPTWMFTVGP